MVGFSGQVSATHDYKLGITVELGGNTNCYVVLAINPFGIGANSGLRVGDKIVAYDGYRFNFTHSFQEWNEVFTRS